VAASDDRPLPCRGEAGFFSSQVGFFRNMEVLSLTAKGNSPFDDIYSPEIMILGIGSILFSDDGFGIQVAQKLEKEYEFPDNVLVVDGGVLGINLLGVISKPRHLIVVDTMRNQGKPGDLYRIEGEAIPERIRAKNSLHQVDFLEALTLCQALDNVPKTVIIGIEPEDIQTLSLVLTPTLQAQVEPVVGMVLKELERLGISYRKKDPANHVSRDSVENNPD
jgi:hydrogenase maturation protease